MARSRTLARRAIQLPVMGAGGAPAISVSPSSWDFGSTPVGTPVSKVFTIENTGTAALEITLPITTPAGFTVTVDPATSVAPGASTTFTVEADAEEVDSFAGNISIESNAAGSPTLIPVTADVRTGYYLNVSTGNDANDGLSSGAAKLTLESALTAIGANDAILFIYAPRPFRVLANPAAISNAGRIDFRPYVGQTEWYLDRAVVYNSGTAAWTNDAGDVWRTAAAAAQNVQVETMLDGTKLLRSGSGIVQRLTQNTGTPTTPSALQYGLSGGQLYVNLGSGIDPNNHRLVRGQLTSLATISAGTHTFRNMVAGYATTDAIIVSGGNQRFVDCQFRFCDFSATGGTATCENCVAYGTSNDGFSINNSANVTLNDCESAWNADEGISPHNSSVLTLNNVYSHHNGHSGMGAVNSSNTTVNGGEYYANGTSPLTLFEGGNGLAFAGTSTGTINGANCYDNIDCGFYCESSGDIVINSITSGLAAGNGDADVVCP